MRPIGTRVFTAEEEASLAKWGYLLRPATEDGIDYEFVTDATPAPVETQEKGDQ